jgi:hypothetical protein
MEDMFERRVNEVRGDVREAFMRLDIVAVLSMLHITRGKAKSDDPLKRNLMTWLGVLEENASKNIE